MAALAKKVKSGPGLVFSLQAFASLLGSGFAPAEAAGVLSGQGWRGLDEAWRSVAGGLRRGLTAGEAFERAGFPPEVCSAVRAGHKAGNLAEAVEKAAEWMGEKRSIKGEAVSSLFYPVAELVLVVGIGVFLGAGVFPKLFSRLPGEPAFAARVFIFVGTLFRDWWFLFAGAAAALTAGAAALWGRRKERILSWTTRIPGVGRVVRDAVLSSLLSRLGMLLESGYAPGEALSWCSSQGGSGAELAGFLAAEVKRGRTLSSAMRRHPLCGRETAALVEAGEKAGNLSAVCRTAAEFHLSRLRASLQRLASFSAPVVTAVVGLVVGGYAAAILSVYRAVGTLGGFR